MRPRSEIRFTHRALRMLDVTKSLLERGVRAPRNPAWNLGPNGIHNWLCVRPPGLEGGGGAHSHHHLTNPKGQPRLLGIWANCGFTFQFVGVRMVAWRMQYHITANSKYLMT